MRDGIPAFVSLVVLSGFVYLASWASWLATSGGHNRDWGLNHPDARSVKLLGATLASWLRYQRDIWNFHTGDFINKAQHSYRADPGGWLIVARPIGIDAVNGITPGTDGCPGPDNCIRVISGIGTPALWWVAVFALIAAAILWIGARDWRFGVPVVGVLAGWLPWFTHDARPLFFFYAIVIIPFSVMAVALCAGRLLGGASSGDRQDDRSDRHRSVHRPGRRQLRLPLPDPDRPPARLSAVAVADVVQELDLTQPFEIPPPGHRRAEARGRRGRRGYR